MHKKFKQNIWDKSYSPYGTYEGLERGNPNEWAQAFKERMSPGEIKEILGDDNPWFILGIPVGSTQAEIKSAFFAKAKETHPDHNPGLDGSEFRRVRAAYEKLT